MKAYTDSKQSKRLAGILPPESADMYWKNGVSDKYIQCFTPFVIDEDVNNVNFEYDVPCWSLAALLGVLPTIDGRNAVFCKDIRCDEWHVFYHSTATLPLIDTERYHDIVDACVAMIEKLHEQKLL